MFSLCLFICLFAGLRESYSTDARKIRKKPLDCGGNPDNVTVI